MAREEGIEAMQQKLNEQTEMINELRRTIEGSNRIIDELSQAKTGLSETVEVLNKTIAELTERIKELTEMLGKNSRNSSKPPSSDGLNKPAPKSLREPSGKRPGGQKGHPGTTLTMSAEPDEVIVHMPSACSGCPRHDLCKSYGCVNETRQVIDAVVEVRVTAHQSVVIENCPLHGGKRTAEFPDEIKAPVQYGENLQALVIALNTIGAVSVNRTHEILSSVFSIPLSTGVISNMVSRCANSLTATVEMIRKKMIASPIGNFDETGTRVDGKTMWVHNASNTEYTYLTISSKRGAEGMEEGGVLPEFLGTAIHDCWASYWTYTLIIHALCNAHILRELIGILENHPDQVWASDFKKLLLAMKAVKEKHIESGKEQLSAYFLRKFDRMYDEIINRAYAANPLPPETAVKKRGRKKKGKVLALIERLNTYKASVCLFIKDFAVPFDNNQAERDLRMIKTKTKVSGCFRSIEGARDYLKIMSYVGTAKKQGIKAYDAVRRAILGAPDSIFCWQT